MRLIDADRLLARAKTDFDIGWRDCYKEVESLVNAEYTVEPHGIYGKFLKSKLPTNSGISIPVGWYKYTCSNCNSYFSFRGELTTNRLLGHRFCSSCGSKIVGVEEVPGDRECNKKCDKCVLKKNKDCPGVEAV